MVVDEWGDIARTRWQVAALVATDRDERPEHHLVCTLTLEADLNPGLGSSIPLTHGTEGRCPRPAFP